MQPTRDSDSRPDLSWSSGVSFTNKSNSHINDLSWSQSIWYMPSSHLTTKTLHWRFWHPIPGFTFAITGYIDLNWCPSFKGQLNGLTKLFLVIWHLKSQVRSSLNCNSPVNSKDFHWDWCAPPQLWLTRVGTRFELTVVPDCMGINWYALLRVKMRTIVTSNDKNLWPAFQHL